MNMRHHRGFTLIEMIVALAVVAIALGAIIAGMARFAGNAAHLRERTLALWVAHNALTELEVQRSWPDVGKRDGKSEMGGVEWRWTIVVQKTPDEHLRRADVEVIGQDGTSVVARLPAFLADAGRR